MELQEYLCIIFTASLLLPRKTLRFVTDTGFSFPPAPAFHFPHSQCGHGGDRLHTALRWSQQAHFESELDDSLHCFDCGVVSSGLSRALDLSTPRGWLESWPDGAYTVVRCDYRRDTQTWKIWGQEYHIERLKASYDEFLKKSPQPTPSGILERQSQRILHGILQEAAYEASSLSESTFMVTLLCHPCERLGHRIRGHICSINLSDGLPDPVTISIANAATALQLPNRLHLPRAKLSSWCRDRRPLEERFKVRDVSEVILTQRQQQGCFDGQRTRLLEGLTSNLFVIRKDKALQTAKENVLHGYARHRVLQKAQQLGLTVLLEPPHLEDRDTWEGLFITSSVKLIVPVGQIVSARSDDDASMETLWSSPSPGKLCSDLFAAISKSDE